MSSNVWNSPRTRSYLAYKAFMAVWESLGCINVFFLCPPDTFKQKGAKSDFKSQNKKEMKYGYFPGGDGGMHKFINSNFWGKIIMINEKGLVTKNWHGSQHAEIRTCEWSVLTPGVSWLITDLWVFAENMLH